MEDFLSLLMPMIVVVLIIVAAYMTTKWIAKKQNSFTSGRIIQVIERIMLSKEVSLSIIQVDTKLYLISVSSGKTEMLAELPADIADKYKTPDRPVDFMSTLMSFIGNKDGENKFKGWNKKN